MANVFSKFFSFFQTKSKGGIPNNKPRGFSAINVAGISFANYIADYNTIIEKGYKGNGDVFAIIDRIANRAVEAEIEVYNITPDKKKAKMYKYYKVPRNSSDILKHKVYAQKALSEANEGDPLRIILEKPNDYQTQKEFLDSVFRWYKLTGDCGILLLKSEISNKVLSMHVIAPFEYELIQDGFKNITGYRILATGAVLGIDEFISIRAWNPTNSMKFGEINRGVSPLTPSVQSLQTSNSAKEASSALFETRGATGIVSIDDSYTAGYTESEEANIQEKIRQKIYGTASTGRIVYFNTKMNYTRLYQNAQELNIAELGKQSTEELCRVFAFPFLLLNSDSSSYNNYQTAVKQLLFEAVMPLQVKIADAVKAGLCNSLRLDSSKYEVKFDIEAYRELSDNLKDVADVVSTLHGKGLFTQNEFRVMLDYDKIEVPEFEQALVVPNLVPLSDLSVNLSNDPANDGSYTV